MVGVVARKVAAGKLVGQRLSELLEGGFVLHVVVGDTRELRDHRIDGLLGVH